MPKPHLAAVLPGLFTKYVRMAEALPLLDGGSLPWVVFRLSQNPTKIE